MEKKSALVVTSIAAPNAVLKSLAEGATKNQSEFIVIGDVPSPKDFKIDGCHFYSIEDQEKMGFKLVENLPLRHYARKNLGYLQAIKNGASLIQETDDDNFPRDTFWASKKRKANIPVSENDGWLNVYTYFTDKFIWPRGFPLEYIRHEHPLVSHFEAKEIVCPVQQGLADDNPDVDAVFRLTYPLPLQFNDFEMAIGQRSWCPFNSQNTVWFKEAFGLMYLPSYCTFRMTDIWRSFVAQRIMWENGWHLKFHQATVWQERNEHDLMKDFKDEIPGYLNNNQIIKTLEALDLKAGQEYIGDNLLKCYEALVQKQWVGEKELDLISAWNEDLKHLL